MTRFETLSLLLSALGLLFIPTLVLLFRGAMKWTRVEDKLDEAVKDLGEIVANENRAHADIVRQMADDRAATNQRLRWLEENVWKQQRLRLCFISWITLALLEREDGITSGLVSGLISLNWLLLEHCIGM